MPKSSPNTVGNGDRRQPQMKQTRAASVDGAPDVTSSLSRSAAMRSAGKTGNRPSPAMDETAAPSTNGNSAALDVDETLSSANGGHSRCGDVAGYGRSAAATLHHRSTSGGGSGSSSSRMPARNMAVHVNGCFCSDSGAAMSSSSIVTVATGVNEDETVADKNNNKINVRGSRSRRRKTNVEELLKTYFPVTLQAFGDNGETLRRRRRSDTVGADSVRRSPGHLSQSQQHAAGGSPRRMRSAGSRQSSARSSSSSASNSSFDRIYLAAFDDGRLGQLVEMSISSFVHLTMLSAA
jgi:hypothetical protein